MKKPPHDLNMVAILADFTQLRHLTMSGSTFDLTMSLNKREQGLLLLVLWVLFAEEIASKLGRLALEKLIEETKNLAVHLVPSQVIDDQDRREELIRFALKLIEVLPDGESEAQFLDRWDSISTVSQKRLLKESSEARRRAEEIRERMKRAEAEAAAAKVSRE